MIIKKRNNAVICLVSTQRQSIFKTPISFKRFKGVIAFAYWLVEVELLWAFENFPNDIDYLFYLMTYKMHYGVNLHYP